ncbi:hypothetical protein MASR1M74_10200 [Lentimicrobium sp.]
MRLFLSGLCLIGLFTLNVTGQNNQPFIRGCLPEVKEKKIYLEAFYGSSAFLADSSYADVTGCFILTPPSNRQGYYRIIFPGRRFMDLIFNNSSIYFQSTLNAIIDSTLFTNDPENQLYYTYLRHRLQLSQVRQKLLYVLKKADTGSAAYQDSRRDFIQLQQEDTDFITHLTAGYPPSLTTLLIQTDRFVPFDPAWSSAFKEKYIFDHYLDYIDLTDTLLLYTNALSAKIISYMNQATLADNDRKINQEFYEASVKLLAGCGNSKPVFDFIHEYLINGFNRLNLDSLSRAIHSINFPCCYCSDSIAQNFETAAAVNQKLPKLKLKRGKETLTLPVNGNKYVLVFIDESCHWSTELLRELNQAALLKSFSDKYTMVVIDLNTNKVSSQSQHFQLTQGTARRLQRKKLMGNAFPFVWIIDEAGVVEKHLPNWVIFRRWVRSQFPAGSEDIYNMSGF